MKSLILLTLLVILSSCNNEKSESKNSFSDVLIENEPVNFKQFIGGDFLIDKQHSYIGFKIKYFGFSPVRGRFNEFDGTLFYNDSSITSLSTSIFIDVNTINTGNETRDNDLKSEGSWFDMANYPTISFKSTQVLPKSDGTFNLIGDLTIKGITLSDTISFDKPTDFSKDWAGNDQVDFSGSITINRQDYKVFGGDFWSSVMENGLTQLSDEVEIEIEIHCRKADYQFRYDTADSLDLNKEVLDVIKSKGLAQGLTKIDSLYQNEELTAGKLSSIGYTLNVWGLHEQAFVIFNKRLELYPNLNSTWNQLGITNLYLSNIQEAEKNFQNALETESNDSRALEYKRLIKKINATH
jgi:polyisoprenoid-binding protein YceI